MLLQKPFMKSEPSVTLIPEHPLNELGLHNRSSFFENFSNWQLLHLHHQVRKVKLPENHKKNQLNLEPESVLSLIFPKSESNTLNT